MGLYSVNEIEFVVKGGSTKEQLHELVIHEFLKEKPGTGKGKDASRYRYNVEKLADGKRVFLTRPARLKMGFDFRISVEGMRFLTKHDYPKHEDITRDLWQKKKKHPDKAGKLHEAIRRVYECEDPSDILPDYASFDFGIGYSVELLLKVIKWFFIEQDIRGWNYSGRKMFMDGVTNILLS